MYVNKSPSMKGMEFSFFHIVVLYDETEFRDI